MVHERSHRTSFTDVRLRQLRDSTEEMRIVVALAIFSPSSSALKTVPVLLTLVLLLTPLLSHDPCANPALTSRLFTDECQPLVRNLGRSLINRAYERRRRPVSSTAENVRTKPRQTLEYKCLRRKSLRVGLVWW